MPGKVHPAPGGRANGLGRCIGRKREMAAQELDTESAFGERRRDCGIDLRRRRIAVRKIDIGHKSAEHRHIDAGPGFANVVHNCGSRTHHVDAGGHAAHGSHAKAHRLRRDMKMRVDDAGLHNQAGSINRFMCRSRGPRLDERNAPALNRHVGFSEEARGGIRSLTVLNQKIKQGRLLRRG